MRAIDREPLQHEYDSFEEWEDAHRVWEDAVDDYCEEYLERRRN